MKKSLGVIAAADLEKMFIKVSNFMYSSHIL